MNIYNDEEVRQQLISYKVQIVVSFLFILATIITITVIRDLYYKVANGMDNKQDCSMNRRSRLATLLLVFTALYLVLLAYSNYKKEKTKNNLWFLIAAELALIAAVIRYVNINRTDVTGLDSIL